MALTRLYTVPEAAEALKVTEAAIRRWIWQRRLTVVKIGSAVRIDIPVRAVRGGAAAGASTCAVRWIAWPSYSSRSSTRQTPTSSPTACEPADTASPASRPSAASLASKAMRISFSDTSTKLSPPTLAV